jgi:hypothetical protein
MVGGISKLTGSSFLLALAFFLPVAAQAAAYEPSNCRRHSGNPAEKARDIYARSKPVCSAHAQTFQTLEKIFYGPYSLTRRIATTEQQSNSIVEDFQKNQANKVDSQYGANSAGTIVNDFLTKMRVKRAELEKLDADLDKVKKEIEASFYKSFNLIEPFTSRAELVRKAIHDREREIADAKSGITADEGEVNRLTQIYNAEESPIVKAKRGSERETVLRRLNARKEKIPTIQQDLQKLNQAKTDLESGLWDTKQDAAAFKKAATDYEKQKYKIRLAKARITLSDPASPKKDQEAAKVDLARSGTGSDITGTGKGGVGGGQANELATTEDKKALDASMAKSQLAGGLYKSANEDIEKKILNGEIDPKTFGSGDVVEQMLKAQKDGTADAVVRDSKYFTSDEQRDQVTKELEQFKENGLKPAMKGLVGMDTKVTEDNWFFDKWGPKDPDKAKEYYDTYNNEFEKMSPLAQKYAMEEWHVPREINNDEMYYTTLAKHDYFGQSEGGAWDDSVDAVSSTLGEKGIYHTGKIEDPGWATFADRNMPGTKSEFQDSVDAFAASRIRENTYMVNGSTENMNTWEKLSSYNTENFDQALAKYDESKLKVDYAQKMYDEGTVTQVYGGKGGAIKVDPAVTLANARENWRDSGAHYMSLAPGALGEVVAHNPSAATEAMDFVKVDPSVNTTSGLVPDAFKSDNRIAQQESKAFWQEQGLTIFTGPVGGQIVTDRYYEQDKWFSAGADTYGTKEFDKAEQEAQKMADLNQGMTVGAAAFTVTGQTVIAGTVIKGAKAAYMGGTAARLEARAGETIARNVGNAGQAIEEITPSPELSVSSTHYGPSRPAEVPSKQLDLFDDAPTVARQAPVETVARKAAPSQQLDLFDEAPKVVKQAPVEAVARKVPAPSTVLRDIPPETIKAVDEAPQVIKQAPVEAVARKPSAPQQLDLFDEAPETLRPAAAYTPTNQASHGAPAYVKPGAPPSAVARRVSAPAVEAADSAPRAVRSGAPVSAVARHVDDAPKAAAEVVEEAAPVVARQAPPDVIRRQVPEVVDDLPAAPPVVYGPPLAVTRDAPSPLTLAQMGAREAPSAPPAGFIPRAAEQTPPPSSYEIAQAGARPRAPARAPAEFIPRAADDGPVRPFRASIPDRSNPSSASRATSSVSGEADTATRQAANQTANNALKNMGARVAQQADNAAEQTSAASRVIRAAEEAAEVETKAGTFAEDVVKWAEPESRVSKQLTHIAKLSEVKGVRQTDPALYEQMAKDFGMTPEKYTKYIDRRIKYFSKKLDHKYTITPTRTEKFARAVENGAIKPEEYGDYVKKIARDGVVNSHTARPLIATAEKRLNKALEKAAKSGDVSGLKTALKDAKVPEKLADEVSDAVKAAHASGEAAEDSFKETMPFLSRSLAENSVLANEIAPTLGRDGFENFALLFTHPGKLMSGAAQRYIESPFRRLGQWLDDKARWSVGAKRNIAAKSFATMELEGRLAEGAARKGGAAARLAGEISKIEENPSLATMLAAKSDMPEKAPEGSLLKEAEDYAPKIEDRVAAVLKAGAEKDPARRQFEIEKALRALKAQHQLPEDGIQHLREFAEAGGGLTLRADEIAAQTRELARAKILSGTNVAPRVAKMERELASAVKGAGKSEKAQARTLKKLEALGVDEELSHMLIAAEKLNPGELAHGGGFRNVAESMILKSDASTMLKKDFALNTAERFRRWATGSKTLAILGAKAIYHAPGLISGFLDPSKDNSFWARRARAAEFLASESPAVRAIPQGVSSVSELNQARRMESLQDMALAGMVRAAAFGKDKELTKASQEMFQLAEKALLDSGQSAESVQAARRLIEGDTGLMSQMLERTPRDNANFISDVLSSEGRMNDYRSLLKAGGYKGREAESTAVQQLLTRFEKIEELNHGTRKSGQEMAEALARKGNGDLKLAMGGIDPASGAEGQILKNAEGQMVLRTYEGAGDAGRIGGEALIAHEGTHVETTRLISSLNQLEAAGDEQGVLRIASRSAEFSSEGDTVVNKLNGYQNFYAADEVNAHVEQARKEIAMSRLFQNQSGGRESKLRSTASQVLAGNALGSAQRMVAANQENLGRVKAALSDGSAQLYYDKASGAAVARVPKGNGAFTYKAYMPKGLKDSEAKSRLAEVVDYSLGEAQSDAQKSMNYLAKELGRQETRLANGKSAAPGTIRPVMARGVPMYTEASLRNASPALKQAAEFRVARDAQKSDARRIALSTATARADRAELLRLEENYLARMAAVDTLYEKEYAGVAARLAGDRYARAQEALRAKGSPTARKEARRRSLGGMLKNQLAPYAAEHFPEQSLSSVLKDSHKVDFLSALYAHDTALASRYARESQQALARTIGKFVPDAKNSEKMAKDLVEAQAAAANAETIAAREKMVANALADKGWKPEQVRNCLTQEICSPKLAARSGSTKEADASPLAHEVLMESELARASRQEADEALAAADVPEQKPAKTFSAEREELETQKQALAREARSKEKMLQADPNDKGLSSALNEVKQAQQEVDDQLAFLAKNENTLGSAKPLTTADEELNDRAVAAVMNFLSSDDSKKLGEIDSSLAKVSQAGVKEGSKRLEGYQKFKKAVSELPREKQSSIYRTVESHAEKSGRSFAKDLKGAEKLNDQAFVKAVEKSKEVSTATDNSALVHAAAKAEAGSGERLALAEAIGAVKGEKSQLEEAAELGAKSKALEQETKAAVKAEGRALASNSKPETELAKIAFLDDAARAELAKSIATLEKNADDARNAARSLASMATDPDNFETYRMAYVSAAEALRGGADRKQAWEKGVRKMLEDSGYSREEIEGTAANPGLFQKSLACLKML